MSILGVLVFSWSLTTPATYLERSPGHRKAEDISTSITNIIVPVTSCMRELPHPPISRVPFASFLKALKRI